MIPDLLFRPRAQILAIQEENFLKMLDLCFKRHPYYRESFKKLGLSRNDFKGLDDIVKIPVVTKADYANAPESFRLETVGLSREATISWDVMHTTGTTGGHPTPFHSTTYDFYRILTANRRALEIRGVKNLDIVANLCPMTLHPYGAYHRTIAAANAMKIPVVSPLPGRPSSDFHWSASLDEVVEAVARSRATILWGVCSYVRRVLIRAGELEADLSTVRLAFVTGEPVSEEMRRDVTQRMILLGAMNPWVSISYAATEMQVGTVECGPKFGYHNPAPDQFYFEIVHPDTHKRQPLGETGLAVMTHLDRRGTVLLRYALGDLTAQTNEKCPNCGATTDRFIELPSRSDGLVKIRGMLVDPETVISQIIANGQVSEFQLVIEPEIENDQFSMDRLRIRLAVQNGKKGCFAALANEIRATTGIRPIIEEVTAYQIYDPDKSLKAMRLVDLRKK